MSFLVRISTPLQHGLTSFDFVKLCRNAFFIFIETNQWVHILNFDFSLPSINEDHINVAYSGNRSFATFYFLFNRRFSFAWESLGRGEMEKSSHCDTQCKKCSSKLTDGDCFFSFLSFFFLSPQCICAKQRFPWYLTRLTMEEHAVQSRFSLQPCSFNNECKWRSEWPRRIALCGTARTTWNAHLRLAFIIFSREGASP